MHTPLLTHKVALTPFTTQMVQPVAEPYAHTGNAPYDTLSIATVSVVIVILTDAVVLSVDAACATGFDQILILNTGQLLSSFSSSIT